MANVLKTTICEGTLDQALSQNLIEKYLLSHQGQGEELSDNEKVALRHAIIALQGAVQNEVKMMIHQFGLEFWAEIFGPEGSKCQYSKQGFCTKEEGNYQSPTQLCGYCYDHVEIEESSCASWRVCVRTEKALKAYTKADVFLTAI